MSNTFMTEFPKLLENRFPDKFTFIDETKKTEMPRLDIRCATRQHGFATVEFVLDELRLTLCEDDHLNDFTVWVIEDAKDFLKRLEPWAFPPAWMPPQPIDASTEKKRLQTLSQALTKRDAESKCFLANTFFAHLLTDDARKQFDMDIASMSTSRILHNFPWDELGRLKLKTSVLLRDYETTKSPGKDRTVCLAAVAPDKRSELQDIQIKLVDLIIPNQTHNWSAQPHLWQDVDVPEIPDPQQAMKSIELLDSGKIEEALAMFGVSCSDEVHQIIGGQRIRKVACCANQDEDWTRLTIETLRSSAPWLLRKAVEDEITQRKVWIAEKKGRNKYFKPELRLLIFPAQVHQVKASLMLAADVDGTNVTLEVQATGSNTRPPDTSWKRPIDFDFQRYGISR